MSFEWTPFTELLAKIIDNRGKTCPVGNAGVPLIATNCVSNNSLYPAYDTTRFVDEETYRNWFRGHPEPGDILFVCKGSPGRSNWVPDPVDFCIAQDMVAVRANPERIYPKYLFAALRSSIVQSQIDNMHVGTMIPHFKKGDFDKLKIPVPSGAEQEFIGDLYFIISERIALLRETNATLEAIAQTLFKSWFVDFDPVHARARGEQPAGLGPEVAALFPDSFEESELGMVPKGWSWSVLGNVCTDHGGTIQTGPFGSQLHASDYVQEGTPVVMPKDISGRRVDGGTAARIGMADVERLSRHQLQIGDIVFSRRGDVEKHALIGELEQGWLCGTGCLLVRPGKNWSSPGFLSRLLDLQSTKRWLTQHAVGATMPNLNTGILAAVPVLLPSREVLIEFELLTHVLDTRISENNATIQTLASLRDTLLPRLISGQLRLPDAEQQLKDLAV
ncbi:restriction endonuclease subunit S [Aeromonas veronii]|uniref:restriction endonuclease subunit S n=1 Tax=Aeromonas veronii TaxID=654 RepID=UPI003A2C0433